MSKKANPAAIGIFVVGAIFLAVVAILLFGSGEVFHKTEKFILYFDDSINGLDVGAPVKFKGVKIGQVDRIYIRHNQIEDSVSIPVLIDVDTERLMHTLGVNVDLSDPTEFENQVKFGGLRGRLLQASYVTGLLYLELDYYPGTGMPIHKQDPDNPLYLEIPTIPSEFTEIFETAAATLNSVSKVNFVRIGKLVEDILYTLEKGLADVQFEHINKGVIDTLSAAEALMTNPDLLAAVENFNSTLSDGKALVRNIDSQIIPLVTEVKLTTQKARHTLDAFQLLSKNASTVLNPNSTLILEIESALSEFRDAAKAIAMLAEFIEQNPNAFLSGKQPP